MLKSKGKSERNGLWDWGRTYLVEHGSRHTALQQLASFKNRNLSPLWLASIELAWDHSDPADRVIVSTAGIHKASIVTSDAILSEYYKRTIW